MNTIRRSLGGTKPRPLGFVLPVVAAEIRARAAQPTVAEECDRRRGCRAGLKGLAVEHRGERWMVKGSEWGRDEKLLLHLVPADRAEAFHADQARIYAEHSGEMGVVWLADLFKISAEMNRLHPGLPVRVMADQAILASRWKHVCCRPAAN